MQIEPGPIPTFTASAPASISASVASAVATLPAITSTGDARLDPAHHLDHAERMSVRRVDDEHIGAGGDECLRALDRVGADADGGADAQPAALVLRRVRVLDLLLNVLDRDEPAQLAVGIDDRQLLDLVAVQDLLGLLRASCRPAP